MSFHATPDTRHLTPRRGVTLIELLVVILIIGLLAALVLGVAAVAGETAREQHTKHVVQRLHSLLMEYQSTFKTRRVRLNPAVEAIINNDSTTTAARKGQLKAEARLYALRELMVMEIPDRWSDVLLNAVPSTISGFNDSLKPIYLDPASLSFNGRTDLAEAYLRRYNAIANGSPKPAGDVLTQNQGAECLYMVIMMATGEGEARALFGESSIGDTDGDGALEFVDGWGHPISFLRWAPGFESPIQLDANPLSNPTDPQDPMDPTGSSTAWLSAAAGDHDPYDMFRADQFAFRLVPLIFSGGRDETLGIREANTYVTWVPTSTPPAGQMANGWPRLSPYFQATDGSKGFLGTADLDRSSVDNVHNHLLGKR